MRWGDAMTERAEARRLEDLGVRRALSPGEVLVHEGDTSDCVFLVTSGHLDVAVATPTGNVAMAQCGPGELIGEVAALVGLPRSATLTAADGAHVVTIEPAVFASWLDEHPDAAARVCDEARHRLNRVQVAEIAIDVLGDAAGELVPQILDVAEWFDLAAGEMLFAEGDPADAAYFVLSGRVQATRRAADGTTQVVGDIGRGEVVGEMAIIQQAPRSASVRALRDTTLARFPIADFEVLLMKQPALLLLVARRMVARLVGRSAPAHAARSVAVAVVADIDVDDTVATMLAALRPIGHSMALGSSQLDAILGRDGIAQAAGTDVADARVSQVLAEFEAAHEHLVYVTDRTDTAWSRRVIQRADTVVVIGSATPSAAERDVMRGLLDACTDTRVPRWLAIVEPPSAARPTSTRTVPLSASFDEVHRLRRADANDIARLARLSVGVGTGVVLGGGGARGFAHLGVLRAMRELGIPIDHIGGASMGSIFAALAALYEDLDELTAVCSTQFDRLLDYTVPVVSLLKAKRITANLNEVFGGLEVDDLWIPFYCVSTNLTRSRLEVHRRGDLVTAVRASIAIPGVLPPVPFDDDLLVDGGVLNNVPADIMRADPSIGTVIAVDVAPSAGPGTKENYGMYLSGWQALRQFARRTGGAAYPGVSSVLVRTMITSSERNRAAMKTDGTADLYLDLEMDGVGLLAFDQMTPVVERGYLAARPRLAEWLAGRA